jgi:hypothetical protein
VLSLYVRLPGTRQVPSRLDRRLAAALYQRGIPFSLVSAALLLAAARRTLRGKNAPPLPPVGCLHYFLPVIDELIQTPPDPAYLHYLAERLDPLMKRVSGASTTGQKTSLPSGR